jgi:hypothetical protein
VREARLAMAQPTVHHLARLLRTPHRAQAKHLECGPLALMLAKADSETRSKIEGALREGIARHVKDGKAQFPSAWWLVTARP